MDYKFKNIIILNLYKKNKIFYISIEIKNSL